MDLTDLRSKVSAEIERYRYEHVDGLVGGAWSEQKVHAALKEFRSALVEPYWADVVRRDTAAQVGMPHPPLDRCAIVADDGTGTLLAFDPAAGEYLLVQRHGGMLESFGVNGDAVGCFMAR